jgi:Flp pilus assembly protein TadB
MNNRNLAMLAALAAVVFVVLNFTVENVGTLFLILAVISGLVAVYLYSKQTKK